LSENGSTVCFHITHGAFENINRSYGILKDNELAKMLFVMILRYKIISTHNGLNKVTVKASWEFHDLRSIVIARVDIHGGSIHKGRLKNNTMCSKRILSLTNSYIF
jgi:hypothetical protein